MYASICTTGLERKVKQKAMGKGRLLVRRSHSRPAKSSRSSCRVLHQARLGTLRVWWQRLTSGRRAVAASQRSQVERMQPNQGRHAVRLCERTKTSAIDPMQPIHAARTASTGCGASIGSGDTHSLRRPGAAGLAGLATGRVRGDVFGDDGAVSLSGFAPGAARWRRAGASAPSVTAPPSGAAAWGTGSDRSCPAPSPTGPGETAA